MHGKKKCKILKEIRKQIAKDNDITYVTTECKHQGNCKGTCPKCEAEVRYLEAELEKRRMAGKQVVVAGIAAAMVLTSSCTPESEETRPKTVMFSFPKPCFCCFRPFLMRSNCFRTLS